MEKDIELIIKTICNEQNYDTILIDLIQPEKNKEINEFIEKIHANKNINDLEKREVYEKIF